MCIKDLNIYKGIRDMHIQIFSLTRLQKDPQCYIDIIILLGIIKIVRHSRANTYINKCYSAKYYSVKCCKEKI